MGNTMKKELNDMFMEIAKKTILMAITALSLTAFADVTPQTAWWNIPPTNTVDSVAKDAALVRSADLAPEYATNTAYSAGDVVVHDSMLYRCTNSVPAGTQWAQASASFGRYTPYEMMTNVVANSKTETNVVFSVSGDVFTVSTNGVAVWSSSASAEKKVAMFILPLNPRTTAATNTAVFTDFELKASTNNFTASSEDEKLCFFSQSVIADTGNPTPTANIPYVVDKMKLYVCTSYSTLDYRSYTQIANTLDWKHQINCIVALVDVSCLIRKPGGEWLSDQEEELVWCWMRNIDDDIEREAGSNGPMWQPIAPVKWYSKVPGWAQQL